MYMKMNLEAGNSICGQNTNFKNYKQPITDIKQCKFYKQDNIKITVKDQNMEKVIQYYTVDLTLSGLQFFCSLRKILVETEESRTSPSLLTRIPKENTNILLSRIDDNKPYFNSISSLRLVISLTSNLCISCFICFCSFGLQRTAIKLISSSYSFQMCEHPES